MEQKYDYQVKYVPCQLDGTKRRIGASWVLALKKCGDIGLTRKVLRHLFIKIVAFYSCKGSQWWWWWW